MTTQIELALSPEEYSDRRVIKNAAAALLKITPDRLIEVQILKRSIDARSPRVLYRLIIKVYIDEQPTLKIFSVQYPKVGDQEPVLIVGAGPAGLFAALKCIQLGLKPIILERGKEVKQRRRDLALINRRGVINPDSNYCFGEGGAGTYSDGKLYTRSNKRGAIEEILQTFVVHGASEDILIDARPHIGTNKLPQIITAIRQTILNAGGEIHFNCRVTDLMIHNHKVEGAITAEGNLFSASFVILATGHSARDIYHLLHRKGILLEAKPFALGVRVEHPQEIINQLQYHGNVQRAHLPPASYSIVEQVDRRGVFSFCMCPGGIIAPCATNEQEIVVNGWSPSKRNNPYANSGIVVQVHLDDVKGAAEDPFKLLNFQAAIERYAFQAGGGQLVAPAQRMLDFVEGKLSADLPQNSYFPGTHSALLQEVLPLFIYKSLQKAFPLFGKKMANRFHHQGYYTNEAIVVGVESRTSAPIRIPRDPKTYEHPQIKGLFPCGEGAGYAGGIISAALDGINCAQAIKKMIS